MLEFKTIRHLKADEEFLNFAGERSPTIKITDGSILKIKITNIKTIKPIIYEMPDINLIIYYYACDNLNKKNTTYQVIKSLIL